MALLHIDGFDQYSDIDSVLANPGYSITGSYSTPVLSSDTRFSTGQCIGPVPLGYNSNGQFYYSIGGSLTTIFTGFAVKITLATPISYTSICDLCDSSGATQCFIRYNPSTEKIEAVRGTTVLGASTNAFTLNQWHYIAIKATIDDSIGEINVYIDGQIEINVSNIDTKNTAVNGCAIVRLWLFKLKGAEKALIAYYDDWYIADDSGSVNNSIIPECRVVQLTPNADTAQKDFTASSGSDNYAMVAETAVDGDTTYVSSSTNGDADIYDLSDLPAGTDTVYGISTQIFAKKDDATAITVDFGCISNATPSYSTGNAVTTDYSSRMHIDNVDPDTASAWSVSAVNSLQCGFTVNI